MKYIKTINEFRDINESLLGFVSNKKVKEIFKPIKKVHKGILDMEYSDVNKLQNNLTVEGDLILYHCVNLYKLPKDLTVEGDLIISGSSISDIPENLNIKGNFIIKHTPLADKMSINNIKSIIEERGGKLTGDII